MSKIATIAVSILFAFSAIAAGTSEQKKQPVSVVYDGPVSTATVAAEHDYKLERESCCGPQSE
jgi:hypothetical protein